MLCPAEPFLQLLASYSDSLVLALILFLESPSLVLILKVVYQSHGLISEWHSVGEQVTWPEAQGSQTLPDFTCHGLSAHFCEVSLNSIECCLRPGVFIQLSRSSLCLSNSSSRWRTHWFGCGPSIGIRDGGWSAVCPVGFSAELMLPLLSSELGTEPRPPHMAVMAGDGSGLA